MRRKRKHPIPAAIREDVIERDQYRCVLCHMSRRSSLENFGVDLDVHHIDLTGGWEKPNQSTDNLITVCRMCHQWLHFLLTKMLKSFERIKRPMTK